MKRLTNSLLNKFLNFNLLSRSDNNFWSPDNIEIELKTEIVPTKRGFETLALDLF